VLCIYFSLGVFAALLALIVPGPSKFVSLPNLWLFLGGTALFFFVFRFKKAIMVPVIVLSASSLVLLLLFIQSVTAFTGETEIARIKVLSARDSSMTLDLEPMNKSKQMVLTMEGEIFAPVVRVIIFDDFFVFLGAKTWYRFVGMSSYAKGTNGIAVQKDIVAFPYPNGISEALYGFFEQHESSIPFVKTVQTEVIQKQAKDLSAYSIRVQNDGGVEVQEFR
jgi:hypothetical protein